jgi:putative glutamine amidotransferase
MQPIVGIAAHQAFVGAGEIQTTHEVVAVAYVKAVRKAGGIPMLVPLLEPGEADAFLDRIDGLLLTGGADVDPDVYGAERHEKTVDTQPERDERDLALARAALGRDLPTLAICRGCQVLNVALGGTLVQHVDGHFDVPRYNESVHDVEVEHGSELARWLGTTQLGVNTLHHQAVERTGPDARIVARATDGTIEGIEAINRRAVGVQWHPEMLRHRPDHLALLESLVRQASTGSDA